MCNTLEGAKFDDNNDFPERKKVRSPTHPEWCRRCRLFREDVIMEYQSVELFGNIYKESFPLLVPCDRNCSLP